jgi:hypothetical protein
LGVSSFLENLSVDFVSDLSEDAVPPHIVWNDHAALAHWVQEAFAVWLLGCRDEVMAEEWFSRGWAELVLAPDAAGCYHNVYKVATDCVDQIEAWLQDAVD